MFFNKINQLLFLFLFSLSSIVFAQSELRIAGTIDPKMDGRMISIRTSTESIGLSKALDYKDSCIISNGTFAFTLPASSLERYVISLQNDYFVAQQKKGAVAQLPEAHIFFKPSQVKLNFLDSLLTNYEISGDESNKKLRALAKLASGSNYGPNEILENRLKWVNQNIDSVEVVVGISGLINQIPDNKLNELFTNLPDSFKTSSSAKRINYYLENLTVGKIAPSFVLSDTSGAIINLSTLKGKYVLIEFWASWCVPCRKESPNLVKAYKKYSKKNFEIIGVSVDRDKDSWISAIRQDGLSWIQVLDSRDANKSVMYSQYKLFSIPDNFLIDPNGRIVGKHIYGEELIKKLRALKI